LPLGRTVVVDERFVTAQSPLAVAADLVVCVLRRETPVTAEVDTVATDPFSHPFGDRLDCTRHPASVQSGDLVAHPLSTDTTPQDPGILRLSEQ